MPVNANTKDPVKRENAQVGDVVRDDNGTMYRVIAHSLDRRTLYGNLLSDYRTEAYAINVRTGNSIHAHF